MHILLFTWLKYMLITFLVNDYSFFCWGLCCCSFSFILNFFINSFWLFHSETWTSKNNLCWSESIFIFWKRWIAWNIVMVTSNWITMLWILTLYNWSPFLFKLEILSWTCYSVIVSMCGSIVLVTWLSVCRDLSRKTSGNGRPLN